MSKETPDDWEFVLSGGAEEEIIWTVVERGKGQATGDDNRAKANQTKKGKGQTGSSPSASKRGIPTTMEEVDSMTIEALRKIDLDDANESIAGLIEARLLLQKAVREDKTPLTKVVRHDDKGHSGADDKKGLGEEQEGDSMKAVFDAATVLSKRQERYAAERMYI
ncbi:MAG: hypothetical protein M1814_000293 [Vezdaea aestivalis]|nr:MAG: hypothetical protein M1814_000293 [Vezdaea aestivalis]